MKPSTTPSNSLAKSFLGSSPYRRRQIIWGAILSTILFILYIRSSQYSPVDRFISIATTKYKAPKGPTPEIYGLLHMVTSPENHVMDHDGAVNPDQQLGLRSYLKKGTKTDWVKNVQKIERDYPVIVFSKVCVSHLHFVWGLLLINLSDLLPVR